MSEVTEYFLFSQLSYFLEDEKAANCFLNPLPKQNTVLWQRVYVNWNGFLDCFMIFVSRLLVQLSYIATIRSRFTLMLIFFFFHEHTKHIEIDCHFVRGTFQDSFLAPSYIRSEFQLADVLTKAPHFMQFHHLAHKLGIVDLHPPTWEGHW